MPRIPLRYYFMAGPIVFLLWAAQYPLYWFMVEGSKVLQEIVK